MTAAVERGLCPGLSADVSAHGRLTINSVSSGSAINLAWVTFAVEKPSLSGITLLCLGPVAPTGYVEEARLLLHAS
jgi:hypothetical protein